MIKLIILAAVVIFAFSSGILSLGTDNTISFHTDNAKSTFSSLAENVSSHVKVEK